MVKLISQQSQWSAVARELEKEDLKLKSYDKTMFKLFGSVFGNKILDYGAGPGILALGLQKLGAEVKTFDISEEMNSLCAKKIGGNNVYSKAGDIPKRNFDVIICNLVLCIVEEDEVKNILRNIGMELRSSGRVFVGFCNPRIFDVPESNLDLREKTRHVYSENHRYKKIKKEGRYEIIELHRPIEWYEKAFRNCGLELVSTSFTPEYSLNGRVIEDFVIFELRKKAGGVLK